MQKNQTYGETVSRPDYNPTGNQQLEELKEFSQPFIDRLVEIKSRSSSFIVKENIGRTINYLELAISSFEKAAVAIGSNGGGEEEMQSQTAKRGRPALQSH